MIAPTLGGFVLTRAGPHALWGGCVVACFAAAVLHTRAARPRA